MLAEAVNYETNLKTKAFNLEPEQILAVEQFRIELDRALKSPIENLSLPITEKEWKWMDDACIVRYLKATKWDVAPAVKRILNTLTWRRSYKPDEIKPDDIVEEARTGKEFIKGVGKCGRPLLYLIPARENSKDYDRMMRFVVFNIETCIKIMGDDVESIIIVLDYKNVSVMNAPPLSISKKFLSIIGDHYPERLGKSFILNPTWYLWIFFKVLSPFLDPVTTSKMHMISSSKAPKKDAPTEGMGGAVSDICAYIEPSQLLSEYGGTLEWEWNFEEYWAEIERIHRQ